MGLRGLGRAFSDGSFLKILIFFTDNGRFSAGGTIWPPSIGNRVKISPNSRSKCVLDVSYEKITWVRRFD